MEKTNKSFKKRLKVTKNGKILSRAKGQNHFRSRKSGSDKMQRRKLTPVNFAKKVKDKFLNF